MVSTILATDMSKHFADLSKFKSRHLAEDFNPEKSDKILCLEICLHLADISNTTKEFILCKKWVDLLFDEFFL